MTIFDNISALLIKKERIEINLENEKDFSLYMVNRWLSMYSPEIATVLNSTINKWWGIFDTKQEQFDFLFTLLEKSRFKRITYIKKLTKAKKKDEDDVEIEKQAARNNFMSVKQYRELQSQIAG